MYNKAMAKGKRKAGVGMEEAAAAVMGFANLVDALFVKYTGKTLGDLVRESAQRPKELPAGKKTSSTEAEPDMRLADAYAFLGLKPGASIDEVKRNYRNLARVFHSDKGNVMNDEAMKLINRAYERITKGGI